MRQSIITKHLGPTNSLSARIKAQAWAGSVTVEWDYALSPERNHRAAAMALATKYGWSGQWVCGALPDAASAHAVFVCVEGDYGDGFTIGADPERPERAALRALLDAMETPRTRAATDAWQAAIAALNA